MEDLTVEELRQLVLYYKQKASDLEMQLIMTQLKLNRQSHPSAIQEELL